MAEFKPAFEKMIKNEGGYQLHTVKGDRGGMTYAGIARKFHPHWTGWNILDSKQFDDPNLTHLVQIFYKEHFWDKIHGYEIDQQKLAETIFDFAVNAGTQVAVKLAQIVIGSEPDGVLGPISITALNQVKSSEFIPLYTLAKITRYAHICNQNRSQSKFLLGWLNRTLKGVS